MRPKVFAPRPASQNGRKTVFATASLPITWPNTRTPPRLALDMGHVTPHMIFNHYREIVTPEEAERYWNIFRRSQPRISCRWRRGGNRSRRTSSLLRRFRPGNFLVSSHAESSIVSQRTEPGRSICPDCALLWNDKQMLAIGEETSPANQTTRQTDAIHGHS